MIETKLILIEGPPGSGKSTTAQKLANEISISGKGCQCFLEWSPKHPIQIGADSRLGEIITTSIDRESALLQQWGKFVQRQQAQELVTIIESRFWQTSLMLMYAAGHSIEDVLKSNQCVVTVIQELKPVLIYFAVDSPREFAKRTIQIKNKEWQLDGHHSSWAKHIFEAFDSQKWFTDRGLTGPDGMFAFLEEWASISEALYDRLPFPKIKISNPHHEWLLTM